jgi:hypothetical protein
MKGFLACCALLLPVILSGQLIKKKPAPPPPTVEKLAWLAGHWRMEKSGRVIDEQWMAPAAGVMLGMGRTIAKDRVIEHEFMQIRVGPGGTLFYVASPSGQETTTFQLKTLADKEVVFENLTHDFPQRVMYTLRADGSVLAAIEGANPDGTTKRIEFPYVRVSP